MHAEDYDVREGQKQVYFMTRHNLDFSTFNKIGGLLDEHPVKLKKHLEAMGIKIVGRLESHYTFIDDPHGEDIPDGKFSIEIGFPVDRKIAHKGDYFFKETAAYRYIADVQVYPPYNFPWQELREFADTHGLKRTLKERDVHVGLKALGDKQNKIECRLEVECVYRLATQ